MNCPKCDNGDSKVTDSRARSTYIRRRRQCKACSHRWTTNEIHLDALEELKDTSEWKMKQQIREMLVKAFGPL